VNGVTSAIQSQLNGKQATLTPAALTKVDDTNVTLALGGTPSTALLQAVSVTVSWSGTLALTRGGTGSGTAAGARTNLGLDAGGAGDIWVEKAGDTMTGSLTLTGGAVRLDNAQYLYGKNSSGTATRMVGINAGNVMFVGSIDAAIASIAFQVNGSVWATLTADNFQARGLHLAIRTITATATAQASDYTILCDATSGAITVNLPGAATCSGRIYNIKKIDVSANAVTIDGSSTETIDGALTKALAAQWATLQIQSNGTAWFIIG
jgi:hypothetical protein